MITPNDVDSFLQKMAESQTVELPTPTVNAGKPGADPVMQVGFNPMKWIYPAMLLYSVYKSGEQAYGMWDETKKIQDELAKTVMSIDTLAKFNPMKHHNVAPKTEFELAMDRKGLAAANLEDFQNTIQRTNQREIEDKFSGTGVNKPKENKSKLYQQGTPVHVAKTPKITANNRWRRDNDYQTRITKTSV